MLPQAKSDPTRVGEGFYLAPITCNVLRELRGPVGVIGLRSRAMQWAGVPEAPINEDRDLRTSEYDVGPEPHPTEVEGVVLPKAIAGRVERGPQGDLGLGVGSSIAKHRPAGGFT